MKINKRLKAIADLIDYDTNVIDVGCDHALLDIYLTINGRNKCIASDINKNALENAIKNIKKYNLNNKIETIISNGLENIKIPNNNTIIISGMGTNTIIKILENTDIKKIDNLIIQSNNQLYLLRKKLVKLGFYIVKEIVIKEKNIYYDIIKLKKGYKKYNYFEYLYGINLKDKEYIKYLIFKNKKISNSLPYNKFIKKIDLKIRNMYLEKLN